MQAYLRLGLRFGSIRLASGLVVIGIERLRLGAMLVALFCQYLRLTGSCQIGQNLKLTVQILLFLWCLMEIQRRFTLHRYRDFSRIKSIFLNWMILHGKH